MSRHAKRFIFFLSIITLLIRAFPADAADWSDLDEGEHKVFGSEKEQKYRINAFFTEWEQWENHSSFMLLWLYKYTDYPKYTSLRFLPFWYSLSSKIDNRQRTFVPLFLWYNSIQGDEHFTINPIYYSSYDKTDSDRSFLWLLWWGGRNAQNYKSSYLFLPVFYKDSYRREDRPDRGYLWINPLFFSTGSVVSFGDTVISRTRNFSLLHYYSSESGMPSAAVERTWCVPIIPLIYRNSSPRGGHQNIFWLVDYSWWTNDGKDKMRRFWAAPFWFWKGGSDGYNNILPPLIVNLRSPNGESYSHFLPFYMDSRSISSEYNYVERKYTTAYQKELITPFYCSYRTSTGEKKWEGDVQSSSFWFPIIPLYYSAGDVKEGSHRNLVWLLDWHNDTDGRTDRFWFMPFYFSGKDSYRHVLPPLYISWWDAGSRTVVSPLWYYHREKTGNGPADTERFSRLWIPIIPLIYASSASPEGSHKNILMLFDVTRDASGSMKHFWFLPFVTWGRDSYLHIIPPLYLSWKDQDSKTVFSPLWFYYREKAEGDGAETERYSRLWVPLVPVVYTSSSPGGSHTNILALLDWSRDAAGKVNRFWFPPFTTWKRDSYFHVMPPLYLSWRDADEKSVFTPLWYYHTEKEAGDKDTRPERYSRLWIPSLPLLYASSSSPEGSHKNIAMLFDWKWDASDNLKHFWFVPFVFHESGEGGYRHYFPFYFRPSGWTAERGLSYGPFHYDRWSPEENVQWRYLLHYYRNTPAEKQATNIWAPLYFSWERKKTSFTLFLPLYFDYQHSRNRLYVNILGISKSIASGPNPNVSLGVGKQETGYYVDTDISWLYDAVSLATRVTLKAPWKSSDNENGIDTTDDPSMNGKPGEGPKKVSLSDKKSMGRENSRYFWGFKLLFGLTAFEMADSKRHFRLLPLSWITWDSESDDQMKWVLLYLSYKSSDFDYWVLFPLIGKQREGKSHREGYLLNIYWNEYYADEDLMERTFFWPIANWYRSPAKSGWRILPVAWHKETTVDGVHSGRTITPVFYSFSKERLADGKVLRNFSMSPLHFYRRKADDEREIKTQFYPVLPIYFTSSETLTHRDAVPMLPMKNVKADPPASESGYTMTSSRSFLFPLCYWGTESNTGLSSGRGKRSSFLVGLPFLYYSSYMTLEGGEGNAPPAETLIERTFFLLGYYSYSSPASRSSSFLFGLYRHTAEPRARSSRLQLFYGLYTASGKGDSSESWLFPLYSRVNSPDKREFTLLLGFYRDTDYPAEKNSDFSLLYGLFYTAVGHDPRSSYEGGKLLAYTDRVRTWWILPLYYYEKRESEDKPVQRSEWTHYFWLWYKYYESHGEDRYSSTMWFPVLPLMYYNATESRTHVNILGFIDTMSDSARSEGRLRIFPLFYHGTSPARDRYSFLLGLYTHSAYPESRKTVNTFLYWITGTTHRYFKNRTYIEGRSVEYDAAERTWWLAPLYYYQRTKSESGDVAQSDSMHLSWFWYKSYDAYDAQNYRSTFWCPIIPLSYYNATRSYTHLNLLGLFDYMNDSSRNESRFWFLPLVYNRTSPGESSRFILGLYLHSSSDYSRQNMLYVFDHRSWPLQQREGYGALLGLIDYEVSPEIKKFNLAYGLLMSYSGFRQSSDYKFNVLGFMYEQSWMRGTYRNYLTPFYYYEGSERGYTLVIPPLLSYFSGEEREKFQMVGLGALWYRNYKPEESTDRQMLLLGIPYYKVQRKERGYESHGVLWGLLWEKETETETNFSKTSVLKFVYKRVDMNGEVYHRVLGIRF